MADNDKRSVNERLDAIEDKLTFKKKEPTHFTDILVKETGLDAKEYFQGSEATYKVCFTRFTWLMTIAVAVIFILYLIGTICANTFYMEQSTNALTLVILILPIVHMITLLVYLLVSSRKRKLSTSKRARVKFEVTDENFCKVTIKKNYFGIIINTIFLIGEIVSLILIFFVPTTFPHHAFYYVISPLVFASLIVVYSGCSYKGAVYLRFEKEDSYCIYTDSYDNFGWHFVKK